MEWLTTLWNDQPMLLVIGGILLYVVLGGKAPSFLLDLFKPSTPSPTPTPQPDPTRPDIAKLLEQFLPLILDMLTKREAMEGVKTPRLTGHCHNDMLCCVEALIELGKCAEKCGDQATADALYAQIMPFIKMHCNAPGTS